MNVGIVGFGLMGQQRARSLARLGGHRLAAVYDPDPGRAAALTGDMDYRVAPTLEALVAREDVEAVVVAVPHFEARRAVLAALEAGRHVLCEKPLGLSAAESRELLEAAARRGLRLAAGFNYRFYPGVQDARRMIEEGALGRLTHARFLLGHGARPGYELEWKTSRALCGGGVLLDPGVHVIDLVRFLGGEITAGWARLFRSFWNIDVEDNAFLWLETASGCRVEAHVSITEWKSSFRVELLGTEGYLTLTGRGGHYGPQQLRYDRRWSWLDGRSSQAVARDYPPEDVSFAAELAAFFDWIGSPALRAPLGTGEDGRRALEIVEALYRNGDAQLAAL